MEHGTIDASFGECMLKNETTDEQDYEWCEPYFDDYVWNFPCWFDDADDTDDTINKQQNY